MFESVVVAARDRKRLAEIAAVATRFGLDSLTGRLGFGRDDEDAPALPERARRALEALGPSFVKLGQILATRSDLLPPDWIDELGKLHSSAPALPFEDLRAAVEEALGAPPEEAFAAFDPVPLAAASIAQVHRAQLADGTEVVVKIRRPGIAARMEADMRLIAALAAAAEARPAIARLRPREIAAQLSEAILAELDFTREGRNAERFAANFRGQDRVVIPAVHWAFTSESLLVMDFVAGTPPTGADALRAAGIEPGAIAALGADIVLQMVLIDGLFHADPHPGNLLCQPGNRIALLDFGMAGRVSPRRREELLGFVRAITARDPERLADLLAAWTGDAARGALDAAAARLVERHGEGRLILADVVGDVMALLRQEGLSMPADLVLTFKALITLDGVLGRIDPEFDLSRATRRAWRQAMRARYGPDAVRARAGALLAELAAVESDLPRLIRAAAARISQPPPPAPPPPAPDRLLPAAILIGSAAIAAAILLS